MIRAFLHFSNEHAKGCRITGNVKLLGFDMKNNYEKSYLKKRILTKLAARYNRKGIYPIAYL
jgi:hypothetical protein